MDVESLKAEAEDGSIVSQTILGICLLHGIKMDKDHVEAYRWLGIAAERGAPRAILNLGLMVENGWACKQDLARARTLYEEAAACNEWMAYVYLARLFATGRLGKTDEERAFECYSRALLGAEGVESFPELIEAQEYVRQRSGQ